MHYLGLALYAEGSTDYSFLCPLLERLCADLCTSEAVQEVEVSTVLALNHPAHLNNARREQRILAAAKEARGAWGVLFVHADPKAALNGAFAATHPTGRRRKQGISPLLNALGEQVSLPRLRKLTAFALLEDELRQALRELRILP